MKGTHTPTLIISDLQAPFTHTDALDFCLRAASVFACKRIVNIGDEADFHAFSDKYPTDPDGMSPSAEHRACIDVLSDFYKAFPRTYVCTSNHTVRPLKKAFLAGLPQAFLRTYREFLEAPKGWQWADRWVFEGIVYEHGENVSGVNAGMRAAQANMMPTVIGHQHGYGGVQYARSVDRLIFGLNTGCLIDESAYAFRYGKKIRNKPTLGCGVIDKWGVPYFLPMTLTKKGRWTRRLLF